MAPRKPTFDLERFTPAAAAAVLDELNVRNRNLRQAAVDQYARDMARGAWFFTGEPIKFATDGTLLDGQHRLAAIVKSGRTVELAVMRGIPAAAQNVMDTGRARSTADQLSISGVKHAAMVASAAARVIVWDSGATARGDVTFRPTRSELHAWIDAHPEVSDWAEVASRLRKTCDLPPGIILASLIILGRIDADQATEFMTSVATGEDLRRGDPAFALRERLREVRLSRRRVSDPTYFSMIFRAWNYYRRAEQMVMVRNASKTGGILPPRPV